MAEIIRPLKWYCLGLPERKLIQVRLIQTFRLNKPVSLDQLERAGQAHAPTSQKAGLGGLVLVAVAGIGRYVCNRLQRNTNHTIRTSGMTYTLNTASQINAVANT